MKNIARSTIVFVSQADKILLAKKAKKVGAGLWNGYGGKCETGESFVECAVRETMEESGLEIADLQVIARLLFYVGNDEKDGPKLNFANTTFITSNFSSKPEEKPQEMLTPTWFPINSLPLEEMLESDQDWVPRALGAFAKGEVLEEAIFYSADWKYIGSKALEPQEVGRYFNE